VQIGGMGCLPWPMVAGQRRERKREELKGIYEEGCGIFRYFGGEDILGSWWKEGRKEKGKRKRKRICKRKDIFLILKNENIENTDSRV